MEHIIDTLIMGHETQITCSVCEQTLTTGLAEPGEIREFLKSPCPGPLDKEPRIKTNSGDMDLDGSGIPGDLQDLE